MSKWRVYYNVQLERCFEVEADDETGAIKAVSEGGIIVQENDESSELEHIERVD